MNFAPYDLERSLSLTSNSSSGSSSVGALTPSLMSSPAFTQSFDPPVGLRESRTVKQALASAGSRSSEPLLGGAAKRGSIGDLASLTRDTSLLSSAPAARWTAGHRAGSASVDSTRLSGAPGRAGKGLGLVIEEGENRPASGRASPIATSWNTASQGRSSPTPRLFPSPSFSRGSVESPTRVAGATSFPRTGSPERIPSPTRDSLARHGSLMGGGGSHRRTQTLPSSTLGALGLPIVGVEEIPGLHGRKRLSRQMDPSKSFSPSAVFLSSRTLPASATASPTPGSPTRRGGAFASGMGTGGGAGIELQRKNLVAYEYLCHVVEAKEWLSLNIPLSPELLWEDDSVATFEKSLQSGYALAHLARALGGGKERIFVPEKGGKGGAAFDYVQTDNIVKFLTFVRSVGLSDTFIFETNDLYQAKNIPKVIYCIHALSHLLERSGTVGGIQALSGRIEFTEDELKSKQDGLAAGGALPDFGRLGGKKAETRREEIDRLGRENEGFIEAVQALSRGTLGRAQLARRKSEKRAQEETVRRRQMEEDARRAQEVEEARLAGLARQEEALRLEELKREREKEEEEMTIRKLSRDIVGLQARVRGEQARERVREHIALLRGSEPFVVRLQSVVRGRLIRESFGALKSNLRRAETVRVTNERAARQATIERGRKEKENLEKQLRFVEPDVVGVQAHFRGVLARWAYEDRLRRLQQPGAALRLQTIWRGLLARHRYWDLLDGLARAQQNVVRLQSFARGRRQKNQYDLLHAGKNVPIETVREFSNLLDDSQFDHASELEVERLKRELSLAIQEAQTLEGDVKDLELKHAQFAKNLATRKTQRARIGGLAPTRRNDVLAAANDPFSNSPDASSARKLELYQRMFWYLQTSPEYLARLFANAEPLGIGQELRRSLEGTTFGVFGHAHDSREEFLLLKLFKRLIEEELAFLPTVADFARGDFTFIRLATRYGRGAKEKDYLRDVLAPLLLSIIARPDLDLSVDPVAIHLASIAHEETTTGHVSQRPKNVTPQQALYDKITRPIFKDRLIAIRMELSPILSALFASTASMPFGIRYIAREISDALRAKFPDAPDAEIVRAVGYVVYYRFIQPAILAPETFDIIESQVPHVQRCNLAEICKMLNMIAVGHIFPDSVPHLTPCNVFLEPYAERFADWIEDVIRVDQAEVIFKVDDYSEAAATRRPVINISPNEIYRVQQLIAKNLRAVAPAEDDPLRAIVTELGAAPASEGGELAAARAEAITLTLMPCVRAREGTEALFNLTKRQVLAVLQVQSGGNLEEVLGKAVDDEDEDRWFDVLSERARVSSGRRGQLRIEQDDMANLSFMELKGVTVRNLFQLRDRGRVTREDKYQALVDSIASDILSKHHLRMKRRTLLATLQTRLGSLEAKKRYLNDQIHVYRDFMDNGLAATQKNQKTRFHLPWSHQASHLRSLAKAGHKYEFGSFSYPAADLYQRGVLISIEQFGESDYKRLSINISSARVGVFEIVAKLKGIPVPMAKVEITLEELLEAQFAGKSTFAIADVAKAQLNLLIHLINSKFVKDV